MNVFEVVKQTVTTRQAAKMYGIRVSRNGMAVCPFHNDRNPSIKVDIIEGLNRQFRQITKNKPSFTNDDSLRRMLYLASQRIVKHWHARCQNWDMVLSQLEVMFSDRKAG